MLVVVVYASSRPLSFSPLVAVAVVVVVVVVAAAAAAAAAAVHDILSITGASYGVSELFPLRLLLAAEPRRKPLSVSQSAKKKALESSCHLASSS